MIELNYALKYVKWDIIGLAEIRRIGCGIEEYDWCILYYFGETKGHKGVGFLIQKTHKSKIIEFTGISERVALLNMKLDEVNLSIIQVYAPIEQASDEELETFYTDILKAVEKSYQKIIILGDFNAKIGITNPEIQPIIGPFGSGTCNDRGERLKLFSLNGEFTIINTLFKKKETQRWTWMSPDGKTKNEIDYILSNAKTCFTNIEVLRKISFPSDHRLLRATIKINEKKKSRRYFSKPKSNLQSEKEQINYVQVLDQKLDTYIEDNQTLSQLYNAVEKAIVESLEESKVPGTKEQFKVSEETKIMIIKRHILQQKINKTTEEKHKLKQLYKLTKRKVQDEYEAYKLNKYQIGIEKIGSIKRAQKNLQLKKSWIPKLKKGTSITENRKDLVLVATNFYKNLYGHIRNNLMKTTSKINKPTHNKNDLIPFTMIEVDQTIQKLNNNKSPGPDLITNESLKTGRRQLTGLITDIFNKWAGHVVRYSDQRWTKIVTEWRGPTYGKRRVGRPLKRWDDDIRAVAGPRWLAVAADRNHWAQLEEAFTRTGGPKVEQ
ncbi:hypothetical protein K1T71_002332 [Dendrolimus kikuchii]|uniref:Uncharacterized protein n=1 Tax=Dendrolimus kikuchii TaxID=765133 RepID=A0ACC1DCQ1_9NEOP|nr:hypothetical protein K1T71_002332 [Dendrolimus kikuchii]